MCSYTAQPPFIRDMFKEKFDNRGVKIPTIDRKNDVPYKCRVCSKYFLKLRELKDHMKIHEGVKPFECPVCKKGYSVGSYLKTHMLSHRKLYRCGICGHRVCTIYELNDHLGEHIVQQLFECDICKETFSDRNDMKWHIIAHRCDERPFKCRICSEDFRRLKELKDHMQIHPGIKPFECQFCKKGYTMQASLTIHEESHRKPQSCRYCAKIFDTEELLNVHMKKHTNFNKYRLYLECNICKKQFRFKRSLAVHKMAHTQATKFIKSDMYPIGTNVLNVVKNEIRDPLDISDFSYEIQIDDVKIELKGEAN